MKRNKIAWAVFTTNESGDFYMIKGNFGNNKTAAERWMHEHGDDYPGKSLYVRKVEY